MNEVMKQLVDRKSVRVFEEKDITEEVKENILEAAFQAPTAGNQMMYTILNISDQIILDKLAKSCDDQPFIAKSKMTLIFCADYQKWFDAFALAVDKPRKPGVGELLLACNDALIAAQNAVVAAESYGVGSCYIGDIMEKCEYHKELLNLPRYVFPVAMLVFGYPTKQQQERVKPKRFDKKYIVHENTYQKMDAATLEKMFLDQASKKDEDDYDLNAWLQAFYKRKYDSNFSKEMTRSVGEYIKLFQNEE